MVGLVFGAGAIAQAQQDESKDQGRVVQIGRADGGQAENAEDESNQSGFQESLQQELPKYWIGLRGGVIGDDDALRSHVDLPANQGLLVVEIVPDSPAAKAGLKKHDILLRANDVELRDMNDLIELVATEGAKKGQITLDVVRHGERETVYLSPEERPADAYASQGGGMGGGFGGNFPQGFPRDLFGQLEDGGQMPFNFRNFGPGVIVGGQGFANMPNGVSVSVHKEGGKPAQITVKRGNQTWTVEGDDPESLNKLPEDLRPFVERMLRGGSALGMNFQMPNINVPDVQFDDRRLNERLEQMERQMNQLLERLGQNGGDADQPAAEQEEAK
jgi:membrane-associated protease RseP (regulator of RpoE activity)